MEKSFRVRVDKAFGSLLSSASDASSSAFPSVSLWCLTDEEIGRKEWNRDSKTPTPDPSPTQPYPHPGFLDRPPDYGQQVQSDIDEEEDDDNENNPGNKMAEKRINNEPDQVWEIRSSIGLDCTLDNEEEEDEIDKVAVGREDAGDRIYMREMLEYDIDVNDHIELPSSFKHTNRDPRANYVAARLRLREDTEAAGDLHTLNLSDKIVPPKPILKKREIFAFEKSSKRVRFYEEQSSSPTKDGFSDTAAAAPMEEETMIISSYDRNQSLALGGAAETDEAASGLLPQKSASSNDEDAAGLINDGGSGDGSLSENVCARAVPDYLRNPTRYTRYTLESSDDMDEASNRKAYMDFLKVLNKPISSTESQVGEEASEIFRRPLTFHPRKKAPSNSGSIIKNGEESKGKAFAVSFAGGCGDDSLDDDEEDYVMDEVGSETRVLADKSYLKPPGRRYRTRINLDSDDVA